MSDPSALENAIAALRGDARLGRSALVRRLFDYLAESSLAGRSPKEAEVAIEVFGRQPDFDPARDAVARVYIHKLRQRLEAMGAAAQGLTIPRGEYRLVLRESEPETPPPETPPPAPARRRSLVVPALAALLLAMLCSGLTWALIARPDAAGVADTALWSPILANGRPTIIALGDYYIFAEASALEGPGRLVREYTVNSPDDLERFIQDHPERAARYMDLDLRYLPLGSGAALMQVTRALHDAVDLRVIPVSSLTPAMMRDNNIVYVGYLSGLGILRDATFAGSRYAIGETWDDIIDTKTGRHFASGGGSPHPGNVLYPDFGYLATFAGPSGNRFVIIAGTRDAALMQMGQSAVNRGVLDNLGSAAKGGAAEALFGINGMGEVNVDSRLIRSGPLNQAIIWSDAARSRRSFPEG